MPIIRVNAAADHPVMAEGRLAESLAALPEGAPVIVMIHGYKFSPRAGCTPHEHIFALKPSTKSRRALSWPQNLGFGTGNAREGLCIAFGWEARGTLWAARREAARAGHALARLLDRIKGRPVHIVAHSLGARVALKALAGLRRGRVERMILMAAAAFRDEAEAALAAPAGRRVEVLNITSRENDVFDAAWEWLIRPDHALDPSPAAHASPAPRPDRALGAGLGRPDARWLDIQIDHPATLERLAGMGFGIEARGRRICHWSAYLRPGLFTFYTAALRQPARLPLATLRAHLPAAQAPRWSALLRWPGLALPLPLARKASS